MIKQSITYENLDGETVTEDFYFNLTKLEALEQDMMAGGFESIAQQLTKTEDGLKAYQLFKKVLLATYGIRDGQDFIKTQDLRDRFASSPALSELIFSFLQDPAKAALFIKGVLPASVGQSISDEELVKQMNQSVVAAQSVEPPKVEAPEKIKLSQAELQNLSKEELQALYLARRGQ